jgi:hypothetical protein
MLGMTGCVSVPPPHPEAGIHRDELAADINFLAQPALKGRKPGTRGSRAAREYIEERFKAYGLVPWPGEKGYGISFGYGQNLVGVLQGSDPELGKEIILVSAHYDHLGKVGKGRVCLGAADNASGVAALLGVAKQLSLFEARPKRSIAFVAFDCEEMMLLGSFAFTCRKDVENARIVGVVNVDMLGRDFMDAAGHTLFVAGGEHYPELCRTICGFGARAGVRVLPVGTDLVGPRGDHAAFESRPIPCLFFSCGTFRDYHEPTDVAEKLDYADLESSTSVMLGAVREMGGRRDMGRVEDTGWGRAEELKSVTRVMNEVGQARERAGIRPQDAEAFEKLARRASGLLASGRYDEKERMAMISEAAGTLTPYFLPTDASGGTSKPEHTEATAGIDYLEQVYLQHRLVLMEAYRKFVAHILKYRPGPFRGMPKFQYEVCSVTDDDILLKDCGNGRQELHVLLSPVLLEGQSRRTKWLIESFSFVIYANFNGLDCEGTKEQVFDLCLLRLRNGQTNELHAKALEKVLQVVAGARPDESCEELVKERLKRGGFRDESEWIEACIRSDNPDVALEALSSKADDKNGSLHKAACGVIVDSKARGDVRALAIDVAMKKKDQEALLALCDAVGDASPALKREYVAMLSKDYPFGERPEIKAIRPLFEKMVEHEVNAKKTIGGLAQAELKKTSKVDFGKDGGQWRKWVEGHTKTIADAKPSRAGRKILMAER